MGVTLNQHDLEFILKQIKIAEAHSNGAALTEIRLDANGNVITDPALYGPDGVYLGDPAAPRAIPDPKTPFGLRTVDGSYNNLVEGRELWGAADQVMPRMLEGSFLDDQDGDQMPLGPPGGPVVTNTDYGQPGNVADADPRIISNLIVDMSVNNPAAIVAWFNNELATAAFIEKYGKEPAAPGTLDVPAVDGIVETATHREITNEDLSLIPNIAPDEGISASFNGWMTFFGQFFDHGLDLITKSDNGTVFIPLNEDDPLVLGADGVLGTADDLPTHLRFMALTRAQPVEGPDGEVNHVNTTTPFVDQNQTYTSHASHQVFLREYAIVDGVPVATGRLLNGENGGLPTWGDVKAQALEKLGIVLSDIDVLNVPLLRTDAYGEFIRGADGFPQVIVGIGADGIPNTSDDIVASATVDINGIVQPVVIADVNGGLGPVRTAHAFLDDIAHNAAPGMFDSNGDGVPDSMKVADSDTDVSGPADAQPAGTYDDELLDRHFITGDGRGNENIALTAVHHVFHSEHNRQVALNKKTVLESGDIDFINEWLLTDLTPAEVDAIPTDPAALAAYAETLNWDGERLFQMARFATEMQYQHLVFEEFARKVQPAIDPFVFNSVTDINPAIFAEFANTVYRFGHSMLTDTVGRIFVDENGQPLVDPTTWESEADLGLIEAFLNPVEFDQNGAISHEEAAGAIVRGMTLVHGNEIDEFVVGSLRNNLLGLPLDLAAINIARARDTGVPTLNDARAQLFAATGSSFLKPYESWVEFAANLKNPISVVNFLAAYGTHDTILSAGDSLAGRRDAAIKLVFGDQSITDPTEQAAFDADRKAFLNSTGSYSAENTGLNTIDLWIGGLAERILLFGGMLGSTFNAIFEAQLENLQDGDRFYYLTRTQGLNFLNELENNAFSKLIMANTDLIQDPGPDGIKGTADDTVAHHIGIDAFLKYDHILEVNQAMQIGDDPVGNDPVLEALGLGKVVRENPNGSPGNYLRFSGGEHVVLGGTNDADTLIGDLGDDAIWGDGGDDRIEGGQGVDLIMGGAGDDIITDEGDTGDFIKGDEGDDVIANSNGLDILMGGDGKDVFFVGVDDTEVFGGEGDDFIVGGDGVDFLLGNEGDDWIEGGGGFDTIAGDNSELFFNSTILGHDVMFAGSDEQDFDAESGDDIMVQGESVMRNEGMFGFDWSTFQGSQIDGYADMRIKIFTTEQQDILRNRFDKVEALSGWERNDTLIGDDRVAALPDGEGGIEGNTTAANEAVFFNDELTQAGVNRIDGLRELLGNLIDAAPPGATAAELEEMIAFNSGNILLGGGGSDILEGNGGDDVLDGDKWLNVRIRITGNGQENLAENEIATVTSLKHTFTDDFAIVAWQGKSLFDLLIAREIRPNQLHIVREILDGGQEGDVDVAVFNDDLANYTITYNDDGSITVTHVTVTAEIDPATGTNIVSDGVDTLRNIEILRFRDQDVQVSQPATGVPVISDLTPTEGQTLTVDTSAIQDPDGLGPFSFQWQVSEDNGTTWVDIPAGLGGTSASFTPNEGVLGFGSQVGDILRVAVSFTDGSGELETVFSEPTGVVGDNWNAVPFLANTFNGTAGDDIATGTNGLFNIGALGGADTLNGNAGDDILSGLGGNDTLNGGEGNDTLNGGGGTDVAVYSGSVENYAFSLNGANQLTVTDTVGAEGTDTLTSIEQLRFAGTTYTLFNGTNGGATTGGTGGSDILLGHGGVDTLNGNNGADVLVGGAGNDTVNGGGGDDLTLWRVGDGRDFVNGGAATDTVHITGDQTAETFRIYSRAEALAAGMTGLNAATEIVITRNGTDNASIIAELDNIEEIHITGAGGGDTFIPIGDFTPTSLSTSTITIDGTPGDDTIDMSTLSSAHRIVFKSNGGNDTILGMMRPQDVIELPPGANPSDYNIVDNGDGTVTMSNGSNSITFSDDNITQVVPGGSGQGNFTLTESDLAGLKALVNGLEIPGDDDSVPGVRTVSGHGNNIANPDWGAADEPFIRLTGARYGDPDADGNRAINPIFDGLDPRSISNILGEQEANLPKAQDANIFFMAFGQYFDHGLDFIPKGGNGIIEIGGPGAERAPGTDNPADLTRGTVAGFDENGVPIHINKTSPYVDQNQAYGSHELVGQFLREGDGSGGLGSHLLAGGPDPSAPEFNLLPTLRELIQHHWENNTIFYSDSLPNGSIAFRDYYTDYPLEGGATGTLLNAEGAFDPMVVSSIASNFMGSGHSLLLDTNPFINLLDHYVAGDGRANENFALTSMHTIWARNHNFHVENLEAHGFEGTPEEVFQAAKMMNEAEYQRVVFDEFADTLLGGMRGSGSHGHDGYNPQADAGISHEFAAAAYRFGHSLIGQTMTVIDENGQPTQVALFDAFLNPSNESGVFAGPLPPGYVPQPGYEQLGVDSILGGIVQQPAEEVDFNIVDAVRNDLVRINADLFSFNVARSRDLGLGTLNQIRADLMMSQNPYVMEAVGFAGDLSPYTSWEDFQARNGLSDVVIAQFKEAYPDLVLSPEEVAAFQEVNPNIQLLDGANGSKVVKGIDRLDVWVGGLAEKHINGGVVGQTFWVVIHEQLDRLQEGDRFYYTDRFDNFDFYETFIDGQEFSDIIARNTGLTGLPEHIFEVDDEDNGTDTGTGDGTGTDTNNNDDDTTGSGDDDDSETVDDNDDVQTPAPTAHIGGEGTDVLTGTSGADTLLGFGGDDVISGGAGADIIRGDSGNDLLSGEDGRDVIFGGIGDDDIFGGKGADMLYGDDGNDHIFGGAGGDLIQGGAGNDTVFAGAGDDRIVANAGDGNDTYYGDEMSGGTGNDTLDMSAVSADATVDLGSGFMGIGSAFSADSGQDTLWGIENVVTGSGDDVITASSAANVMDGGAGADTFRFLSGGDADGDTIMSFQPGDKIDLSAIDANGGSAGNQSFTLVSGAFTGASGELLVSYETRDGEEFTVVEGNTSGGTDSDFKISIKGTQNLTESDFDL
ncbi:peroxidase family protein [Filomicrobium sp.]|uniref:peroxidase family protein n=1 Tax=Filomicrobium sp. TaxID=2024831 RepID=UPI0025840A6E|nr:peroxidase family protein [Filomicrobium sp.]MCV0370383.1 M10 family metallopeptidase C-terminal domain-containing protein [Filomicrobium sp.]